MKAALPAALAGGQAAARGDGRFGRADAMPAVTDVAARKAGSGAASAATPLHARKGAPASRPGTGAGGAAEDEAPLGPESSSPARKAARRRDTAESERIAIGAEQALASAVNKGSGLKRGADDAAAPRTETVAGKEEGARKEPKLTLVDLRKSAQAKREAAAKDGRPDEPAAAAAPESKAQAGESGREIVRELSLDGRAGASDKSPGGAERAAPGSPASDFRALLAERMQEAWNGEIVQSARIVLRDGDSGTIRLRLRPESLGTVKIELNLADNNISGRIVVESDEAKSAFERNMGELSDAFRRGGFESASLQVSVGSGSGSGSGTGPKGGAGEGPFYSERLRSALGSGAEPSTAQAAYVRQGLAVDMLA